MDSKLSKGLVKRNIIQASHVNILFQLNGIKPIPLRDMPLEEFKEKYPKEYNMLLNIK
jgi:hypothetical protein